MAPIATHAASRLIETLTREAAPDGKPSFLDRLKVAYRLASYDVEVPPDALGSTLVAQLGYGPVPEMVDLLEQRYQQSEATQAPSWPRPPREARRP